MGEILLGLKTRFSGSRRFLVRVEIARTQLARGGGGANR
jgi:hypothetical protein